MSGPIRIQPDPDAIPDALRDREQWIAWRVEQREGEPTKLPIDPSTGAMASTTDPDTWGTFEDAKAFYQDNQAAGLGYVFCNPPEPDSDEYESLTEEKKALADKRRPHTGPFTGVDLDGCRDPETESVESWAKEIVTRLESFTEVSPSGTGIHVLVRGEVPPNGNRSGGVEIYDDARFFTVTGNHLSLTPVTVEERQDALETVHAERVADDTAEETGPADANPGETPEGYEGSDAELIEKAKNAKNGDKFASLWAGDTSGYPSHSEADLALCDLLVFWTGGDRGQMDRLFRESGLYREKWNRDDYRQRTIDKAIDGCSEYYQPNGSDPEPEPDGGESGTSLSPETVAKVAEVEGIGQLKKDRQRAYHTYTVIKNAGTDRFRATSSGEVFWYDDGVWRGGDDGKHQLAVLGMDGLEEWYGKNTLSELVEQVTRRDRVGYDELGVPNGTVATPDGLLCLAGDDSHDLQPGEIRKLKPEDYALGRINTAPDPDAELEGSRWEAFINKSVPDPTERLKLQEYAGYALLPRQPFKKALFLVGPTDSGKGTFLKALAAVIGEENVSNQPLKKLIDSRWGLDKIHGRMVNVSNEVSPKGLKNVETFKEMTGGEDTVTAEKKGQPTYEFTVTQKFLFATNQFPRVPDADDAFFNRCLFAEFPNSVPAKEQDPDLLDTLSGERAIILDWMLDGLDRLLDRGRFTGERSLDDKRALTKSFGDPVTQFAHEALDITGDPEDRVHKSQLHSAFARFCDFERIDDPPVQQTFTSRLKTQPGVNDGESRPVGEGDGKAHVFKGIRVDEAYLQAIQADVPAHAYADGDGDSGAATEGQQARIGQ